VLLQINGIVDSVRLSWGSLSPAVLNNAGKLLGVIASGSFGGWVYGIVSLLEGGRQLNLEEGKKLSVWKATRGCSVYPYMFGQAAIGVGGAFAALFGILTLGNTTHLSSQNDLTDNALYFVSLCVVGGFVGNRLLVGVGERITKQLTDLEKKSTKAMDTARDAETKAENAEVVANQAKDMLVSAWIARDIVEKIERLKEIKQPIPEDLHTEAESVRANLDVYRRTFPTTRILFVVLGNLTFELDHADEALATLEEFIANRKKAKDSGDPADVAAAWYNMACFYAMLSTGDQESMGYSKKETAEVLQNKSLEALEDCLKVSKECGSKQLGQRLAKTKTDPDLKVFEGLDRFRKLIQRYEKNQKS